MENGQSIPEGLQGLKYAFDLVRSALGAIKAGRELMPESEDKEAAFKTLDDAERAMQIAEASIAQDLGYELCRCEFPPTPMLRIGYRDSRSGEAKGITIIYECPKCGVNNSGPYSFHRDKPE